MSEEQTQLILKLLFYWITHDFFKHKILLNPYFTININLFKFTAVDFAGQICI